MGSWTMFGGKCDIAWFTDVDGAIPVERIRAVVVQRRGAASLRRAPLWRRALRMRPFRRRSGGPVVPIDSLPGRWTGSVGNPGAGQVLYSRERAVVVVRGREVPLPVDTRALLVLVEDRGVASGPLIQTYLVNAPTVERPPMDRAASHEEKRARLLAQMEQALLTWHRWLEEEPIIRGFISSAPSDGRA